MKKLSLSFACMLLSCAVLLCSCDGAVKQASNTNLGTKIDKESIETQASIHLRDKNLLYDMYDDTEIVTMYLTVYQGNEAENTNHTWEEINTYSAYDYDEMGVDRYQVSGLLQVGDENGLVAGELGYGQVAPNCTVQIRGQSSSQKVQKNYKIKLKDNKGTFRSQKTIALNKHMGDSVRFKNKLCFDLLSEVDQLMSLRTTFVRLYVKDLTESDEAKFVDYGIYTQVEQLNKTALEAHGLDKRGHLYKVNFCEFQRYEDIIVLKDDPRYDLKAFEEILEIKGDDDHTKLINLLEVINDYSIPIETILEEHFDVENISYWMAFMLLVGNVDTQSRNCYIYSPLNDTRWYILPWDLDGSFSRTQYELENRVDYTEWEKGVSNYWGNVLFQRCLKSEFYRQKLDEAMTDLYAKLTDGRIKEYSDKYAALIKPYVYSSRDLLYAPLTPAQYDIVASSLEKEVHDNYRYYKESYDRPMPFYIGDPVKEGNKYRVVWDPSYDFDAQPITYSFEIAKDYTFANPIVRLENLSFPAAEFDALPKGQYFMRVKAKNADGIETTAFDAYALENGKVYGTKSFFVYDDKIAEDTYVED